MKNPYDLRSQIRFRILLKKQMMSVLTIGIGMQQELIVCCKDFNLYFLGNFLRSFIQWCQGQQCTTPKVSSRITREVDKEASETIHGIIGFRITRCHFRSCVQHFIFLRGRGQIPEKYWSLFHSETFSYPPVYTELYLVRNNTDEY